MSDVGRAYDFYSEVLGFQKVADYGPRILAHNGSCLIALTPAPEQTGGDQGFDENRVGLDHLSLSVENRDELERASGLLAERGISHGEIVDLADFQIYVMMIRDPDNIQIELTAPHS